MDAGGPSTRALFDHHDLEAEKPPHSSSFPLPGDCRDGDGFLIYSAEAGPGTVTARVEVRTGEQTKPGRRAWKR